MLKNKTQKCYAKSYQPNQTEEAFVIKKVKDTIPWMYAIKDVNSKEIVGTFHQQELQKKTSISG